ncbi:hypothetical protein R3P38DRAFT_3307099 [Favolaschia claudopus]|uniref:RING-type domain-containing protein n=1 Tax=Favolaschia claudopus TaxID=2862362 RepID=A0AAW0D8Z8_9AGAR
MAGENNPVVPSKLGLTLVMPLTPEPTTFHSSSYNISLNFTSLISLPSRLLARIRKADDFLFLDAVSTIPTSGAGRAKSNALLTNNGTTNMFPGPYGFFLSGYMLGLVLLGVLLHRIQNIVVPPRTSSPSHQLHRQISRRFFAYSTVRRLYGSVLPLDLNKTSTRLAFHLPTLYFLCKMLVTWAVILLQTSDFYPATESGYIHSLGEWVSRLEMHQVCWRTFCSICAAFSVEAFIRGLDGSGLGLIHMSANTSPFNLIGYSFLLHIYSSPITHVYKPPSLPSRPDKHVIVTIAVPLLQLTIFHILSIRKRWSNHRLFPTALSSMLSLLHFHLTLYSHYYCPSTNTPLSPNPQQPKLKLPLTTHWHAPATPVPLNMGTSFPAPTPPPLGRVPPPAAPTVLYSHPTGSASFPLLNYVPNTFETLLLLTIALTIILNALTQLILTGRVARPLLGLGLSGSNINGGWAWAPPYDEDWGVVLLRVGTASLEATGLRGLGNEMPTIHAPPLASRYPEYGTARLGPTGVLHISNGFGPVGGPTRKRRRGLSNEVRAVDGGAGSNSSSRFFVFSPDLINWRWMKEAWRFFGFWTHVTGWSKGLGGHHHHHPQRQQLGENLAGGQGIEDDEIIIEDEEEEQDIGDDQEGDEVYDRFLRQEEISDDDDGHNHNSAQGWDLGPSSAESEDEDEEEGEEGTERDLLGDAEAVDLYADLGATTPAPVLLAHMTRDEGSPLTRRRYGSLLDAPEATQLGKSLFPVHQSRTELTCVRRNCVICTCETREIICWPCRCLSMCDGCREVLASRASSSKHRCPCCRQLVEGYSRIFIP